MTPDINMGKHGTSHGEDDDFLTEDTIRRMRSTSICNEHDITETPVLRETQEEEEEQKQHHPSHDTNCTTNNNTKKKKRKNKKGNKRGGNNKGCGGNSNSRRRQGSYRIEHDDGNDDDNIPEKGVSTTSRTSHKNNNSSSTIRRSILKAPSSSVAIIDANNNNNGGRSKNNNNDSVSALRFGKEVHIREYARGIGTDVVPTDSGGWPLGLSNELCREVTVPLLLDDMIIRPSNLSDPNPNSDKPESTDLNRDITTNATTKARPMSETDRMRIILPVLDSNYHFKTNDPMDERQSSAHSSSPPNHHHHHHHSKKKTRSSSSFSSSCAPRGYHNPEIEHLGHEIRHELELLRNNRSITGCECRKLKNISGRRGMNERKLREELRKRKLLTPEEARSKNSITKEELAKRLQQAVDEDGCCGEDCPCYKSGIGCHAESCSCWHLSHCVDKKHKTKASAAMEEGEDDDDDICCITKRCGNKNGINATDYKAIEAVRAKFLGSALIHPE